MIRVNLIGRTGKPARPGKSAGPKGPGIRPLPIIWVLVLAGALAGGYFWWSNLTQQRAQLDLDIQVAEARRAELQAVIDQDEVYEQRKASLERRIGAIEVLQRNRVSPVVSLDMLSQAVEDTEFVWVTSLNQTNTTFSLNGTGTSIQAVEAFISNLEDTGYFRNINLGPLQEAGPNYTFQLAMSFLPPLLPGETAAGAAGPGTVR